MKKPQVSIVMGSDSDLEVMQDAHKVLTELGAESETLILSTHRVPQETAKFAKGAKARGIKVIIAGAGGAAALPGSLASLSTLPVIGVPIMTKSLEGLDSLLSMVQMPPGVPVACVGTNSAKNAGLLAAEIIGVENSKIHQKLVEYKSRMAQEVLGKNSKLQKMGIHKYLKEKQVK